MFLETARLWLERSAEGGTVGLMGLRRDETVQRFLGGVVTVWVAEVRFERVLSYWEEHDHGMCLTREDKGAAGLCGLDHLEGGVQLAYKLWTAFWARGYATEAAAAVLRHGFEGLGLHPIVGE